MYLLKVIIRTYYLLFRDLELKLLIYNFIRQDLKVKLNLLN
jgi:hypothetical protein